MDDVQMGVASDWVGLSLGGFWVSAGVSVGKERMKDERWKMKGGTARK